MNDQILWTKPISETAATGTAESYLNRKLGITIAQRELSIDRDNNYAAIFVQHYPIRFAVIIKPNGDKDYPYVDNQTIYPRISGATGLDNKDGWAIGSNTLIYAGGYGLATGLPEHITDIDRGIATALAKELPLPYDIDYAIKQLQKTFDDRENNFADRDSQSGDMGSINYISPRYKSAIPTEIMGMLINHRKTAI